MSLCTLKAHNSGDEQSLWDLQQETQRNDHRDVPNLVELRQGTVVAHTGTSTTLSQARLQCGISAVFSTPALGNWSGTTGDTSTWKVLHLRNFHSFQHRQKPRDVHNRRNCACGTSRLNCLDHTGLSLHNDGREKPTQVSSVLSNFPGNSSPSSNLCQREFRNRQPKHHVETRTTGSGKHAIRVQQKRILGTFTISSMICGTTPRSGPNRKSSTCTTGTRATMSKNCKTMGMSTTLPKN